MICISSLSVILLLLMLDGCSCYKSNYIPYPFKSKQATQNMQSLKQLISRSIATKPTNHSNGKSSFESRIAGGTIVANYGDIPYQIALWNFLDSSFCGGFIVDVKGVRFIITAAHCVWSILITHYQKKEDVDATASVDPKHLSVVLADTNLFVNNQRELYYKVTRVVAHEWYDPRYYLNDIALLFLKHYIYEGLAFKAIPLPVPNFETPDYVTVTGYGLTRSFGMYDGQLRIVEVPIFDWDECKKSVTYSTNNHFCVQNPGHYELAGFCMGDSGEPAVGYNFTENTFYVYGIVSTYHGVYCGADDTPEKLTKVSKYIDWIHGYALAHKLNCGTGQPILDPPSKYPNCKWPYADECHEQKLSSLIAASITCLFITLFVKKGTRINIITIPYTKIRHKLSHKQQNSFREKCL